MLKKDLKFYFMNMKFNKNAFLFIYITIVVCLSTAKSDADDEDSNKKLPFFLGNRPRIISIFSKPPQPDAPKLTGPNIIGHASNVLQGGSIGIEVKPMGGFQGIIQGAKKIIPGSQTLPEIGHPENQKPPPEPYDPPHGGDLETDDDEWELDNSEKPVPEGPSWEDIGENPHDNDDEDDSSIPYEEIINPRLRPQKRPKRSFINSKVYYVPLTFRSNAKPFRVKFVNMESKDRYFAKDKHRLQNI